MLWNYYNFLSSHWLAIWRIFRRSPLSEENYPNRNPAWKQALLIIDFQGNTRKGSSTSLSEAHRCKNVFASVKADEKSGKRYDIQSAVSETGQKAFLILNYIQRKYGRSSMLLTATPFTNSPLEIYSMLSLVGYESLVSSGSVTQRKA